MNKLKHLLQLLSHVRLSSPARSDIVVFDEAGTFLLKQVVLKGLTYETLHSRFETLHLGLPVLWRILINALTDPAGFSPGNTTSFMGQVYRVYLLACLEITAPKIVLTLTDNSYTFQWLSRKYRTARFIGIQNGSRLVNTVTALLPKPPSPASVVSFPELVCFGQFEKDLYTGFGHKIDVFHMVGSLAGSYYKLELAKPDHAPLFDICILSEWESDMHTVSGLKYFYAGLTRLENFMTLYCKERKPRICIAARSQDPEEIAHFAGLFPSAEIIPGNREKMSSYFAMDDSKVVISLCCTAAVEAFGWGKKILLCNLTGSDIYDFPKQGVWTFTEQVYEKFSDRLDRLLAMDDAEYRETSREAAGYLMNYDPKVPVHKYIRGLIDESLAPVPPGPGRS